MRRKMEVTKASAEKVIKDIRRVTRKQYGAEERGRRGGRQAVVTPDRFARARQHLATGLNVRETAARLKIGKTALYKALKAE